MYNQSMKTSELIPLFPQDWCNNPAGFVVHQGFLKSFVEFLEEHDIDSVLPPDRGGSDRGIDLQVSGLGNIDMKGFSLIEGPRSFTWDSEYWKGQTRPIYSETLTDFFVHPFGKSVSEWIVAPAEHLRTSYFLDDAPFYYKDKCQTVQQTTRKLLTHV